MPRSKSGKTHPPVNKDKLKTAVEDVLLREYSVGQSAKNNNVSKTTLLRHLKIHRKSDNDSFTYVSHIAHRKIFSDQEEVLLADYLTTAAKLHYGLSKNGLQKLAYEFAIANKKTVPNSWIAGEKAGREWVRQFLNRHPTLSLRKPEATSLSRATAFNKKNVGDFFRNLKSVYDRFNFNPSNIYNLDETGNTTVHVPPKVLAAKGQKQIGSVTSGERGVNVTMVAAINAVGNQVPPMLIFPRVHFKDHMLKGSPPGAIGGANPSGWINEHLFLDYLKHFIAHVKPTVDNKVLLIYDNHESHISLPAINLAKDNGVTLLTMPPHTSHKLQPLDRTVFGPYKTFYNQASNQWLTNNPGKPISIYDVSEIVGAAYPRAFTINNIVKGFAVTGIWPFNEHIFGEDEFLSSYVTDRPQEDIDGAVADDSIDNSSGQGQVVAGPSTSRDDQQDVVSPQVLRPFPKAGARKNTGKTRRKGSTKILTDTPVKEEIEQYKSTSKNKKITKTLKQTVKSVKKKVFSEDECEQPKKKLTKKNQLMESSSEDSSVENLKLDDSSSDDDPEHFYETIRQNAEIEKMDESPIKEGDFVLVALGTKKVVRHFVAKVVGIVVDGYEVKFYKKIVGTTASRSFVPSDEDISLVNETEVVLHLPAPTSVGLSKRQENQLLFSVDFSDFNII